MSNASLIVQAVVTLAVSGTAAAVITALFARRKVSAEAEAASATAAQTITATAKELLVPLRTEMARLRERVVDLEGEQEIHRRLLVAHADWDALAAAKLAEVGVVIDRPPPLHPPSNLPGWVG